MSDQPNFHLAKDYLKVLNNIITVNFLKYIINYYNLI